MASRLLDTPRFSPSWEMPGPAWIPLRIRLGVNGTRRDAWASGMQCDMGEGRVVYLLVEGRASRPEQVSTLGNTSISHVGTVQDE